jgi:hypothetical protein
MKGKLYFLLILLLNFYMSKAQTFISYEKTTIINLSVKYTFNQNKYIPNTSQYIDPYYMSMAMMQERYDRGYNYVRSELDKVLSLKLINKENLSMLERFKKNHMPFWRSISNADLTKQEVVQNCINDITDIYKFRDIIAEIKLLQSCNTELNRIKARDPDNYIYLKRYKAISLTLDNLENCISNDIINLSWEKTELSLK